MTARTLKKTARRASKAIARLLLCLMCVLPFIIGLEKVKAQTPAVLLISPNSKTFYLNGGTNQLSVDLMAQNVVDMLGYEFVLSYDPTILEYLSSTPSTWLPTISQFYSKLETGKIHYAYAQLGGTGVNGNGTLATITFKAISYGSSSLTFSEPQFCKYARSDRSQHLFNLQSGLVTTTFNPAITANGAITGTASLQGQTTNSGISLTLDDGVYLDRGPFSGTSLNQSGTNLSISPVVMDLYTVTTAQQRYLNIDAGCGKTKAVFGTTSTLNLLKLKGGNAVWTDNEINMQDISAILGVYGQASTLSNPLEADINANGTVDIYDLAMAAANYGLNCATAYADWTP